jgi:hypothetical protein
MPQTPTQDQTRELARRKSGGLDVVLNWDPTEDAVRIIVTDARTGDQFELPIDGERALDAFYHPFAYGRAQPSGSAVRNTP